MSVNTSRLAAGAASLVLGAGLATVALPASAARATTSPYLITYTLQGMSPADQAVHPGESVVFKNGGLPTDSLTITFSTTAGPLANRAIPVAASGTSAPVVIPSAGSYTYTATEKILGLIPKVLTASGQITASAPSTAGGTTPTNTTSGGGGGVGGLLGEGSTAPPAVASGGGGGTANGSGAQGSGTGSSGAGSTGSSGGSGSFDASRFGNGSGNFPNLPGGVLAPVAPQAGLSDGGPAPEIATDPAAGAPNGNFTDPSPATTANRSSDTLANASQSVGTTSSVSGPAAVAATLLALVVIGLARAWATNGPLHRH
ncbi:MAG TPA: hypothetical protein VIJ71_06770 [Mycobacteriales bacterium]